ncbi:MAG: FMN-binding protein [Verrucomicrobiales bacterium]|nr:FMN-binding protein [Verrucomicrobiales bacterium]
MKHVRTAIQWIALPAIAITAPCPAWTATYLSVEQAQQAIFPGVQLVKWELQLTPEQRQAVEKSCGIKVRNPKLAAWKASEGAWFLVDEVIGKHEFITYAVGITADGAVKQIEVMDYRENYGSEVRQSQWRSQFVGKRRGDQFKLDGDIKSISGATLSCRHIMEGVKRLLATYELVLRK